MEKTKNKKLTGRELDDSINYKLFYRPHDGFVGDVIPYYEDGTFYIFYLKDQGDSYNHSIFLIETKDFINYVEKGEVIHSSENKKDQDDWSGTGSICKIDDTYYFFYTGHNNRLKPEEKIMIAKSEGDLYHFKKIKNAFIEPLKDLSFRDFRDPDVFFDNNRNRFILLITTNSPSKGKMIAKYSLSRDLSSFEYEGEVFLNENECFDFHFYNFECSNTFKIGEYWYLSFSCQDDTLWVASSKKRLSNFANPYRLDGKYYYVPKSVSDGKNTYMVGWARGKEGLTNSGVGTWGGNLLVSKIIQKDDGTIYLSKIDNLDTYFDKKKDILKEVELKNNQVSVPLKIYQSFILEGDFNFTNHHGFGIAFGNTLNEKISFNPNTEKIECRTSSSRVDASISIELNPKNTYHFSLVFEGSIAVLYIENKTSLTGRFYDVLDRELVFYSNGNHVKFSNLSLKIK